MPSVYRDVKSVPFELGQSVVGVNVAAGDPAVVDAGEPPDEVVVGVEEVLGPIEGPEVEVEVEVEVEEGDALLLLDKKGQG